MERMTETPFRPREKLVEKQKYFQNIHKHTYLKGPFDKITSVAIPLALAGTVTFMIARGIYNMSHGIGKKENFNDMLKILALFSAVNFTWILAQPNSIHRGYGKMEDSMRTHLK
ncbi:hypothetical protein SAY87_028645 [Trapa incisa]|uniref:Uncharacterized protein n=1 Tax=Trapa incisa TaxID=236973 RepID=A0AAN7QQA2_9MYRT|nr:hypothetical protein SAY87_028645 [Trapa incisa]